MTTIPKTLPSGPATAPARRNGWLAWLSVALLIVGLGAGFLVGRVTKPDTVVPTGLASATVTKMLNDYADAVNAGDAAKIASFFATDAVFTDTAKADGYVVQGNTKIAQAISSWHPLGFQLDKGGTAIVNGQFVAQAANATGGRAMGVFQIKDGKFQHVWIVRP